MEFQVRYRLGRSDNWNGTRENHLGFFSFEGIIPAVTGTVNPQVPGSNPGRGAKILKPHRNVGLFYFTETNQSIGQNSWNAQFLKLRTLLTEYPTNGAARIHKGIGDVFWALLTEGAHTENFLLIQGG